MKLARIVWRQAVYLARIEENEYILLTKESSHPQADVLQEALADGVDFTATGQKIALPEASLRAPVNHPSKLLAVGLNYAEHAGEAKMELPEAPVLFAKMPNSLVGPDATVEWRESDSNRMDYEAELAVVIGKCASRLTVDENPLDYVFAYTCANDVSARDAQFLDKQWVRAKSFDTFCPIGPWLITADEIPDPQNLAIRCIVSGEALQDSSTRHMIFSVAELIRYISRFMTLYPGDVILTGTPDGVGFARRPPRYLQDGDSMTVSIEGIGELTNPCQTI